MQIEKLIEEHKLTMIFVEHDESFSKKIATKEINL
jgi:lincosamide and streptogramin A transport system ATP-binding/permease protein